jgi:glycosyltransferase involved in cell wall biosynthesis
MISVVIPCRGDIWLHKTIDGICESFAGNYPYEIVVVQDENIRPAINQAIENSHGDYIIKTDSHCKFCPDFDTIMMDNYVEDTVMVARRYTLDLETWERSPRIVDYYYLSCPWTHPKGMMMQSCPWISKTEANMNTPIDDLMCFQGSMWMMSRKHWNWLGGLETDDMVYAEHHEISMKTWLGGKRVLINKNAWYAHPAKINRSYHMSMRQVYKDHDYSARYWTDNRWERQVHNFDWLIDKFWPLPTKNSRHRTEKYYWEEDWKSRYYDRAL